MSADNSSFWGNDSIHNEADQIKRQRSALDKKLTPIEVDKEGKTCRIKGSGKLAYEVTLDECSCGDFFRRRLPCKHMYRLAHEVGVFSLSEAPSVAQVVPLVSDKDVDLFLCKATGEVHEQVSIDGIKNRIDKLSARELYALYGCVRIPDDSSIFATLNVEAAKVSIDSGLYTLTNLDITDKLKYLDRPQIEELLDMMTSEKAKSTNRRSNTKTWVKMLSTELLDELQEFSDKIFALAPAPATTGKQNAIKRHILNNYTSVGCCKDCYEKQYGKQLREWEWIFTDMWGCCNAYLIRVNQSVHTQQ